MQNTIENYVDGISLSDYCFSFRVTDLKQWDYCPRILYYVYCLPDIRPTTYKMEIGILTGRKEEQKENRRSLKTYGLTSGEYKFNVPVFSETFGLRGEIDMLICVKEKTPHEYIPVDYKYSRKMGGHFNLQLTAYALMVEEMQGISVRRGFLYSIPERRAHEIPISQRLRNKLIRTLEAMRTMIRSEKMPLPTPQPRKCVRCEFRRFCNDIF